MALGYWQINTGFNPLNFRLISVDMTGFLLEATVHATE